MKSIKRKISTMNIAVISLIAGIYTALCTVFAPMSFLPVQVRVAEALTLLPVFSPIGIWGVTIGCALSNFVGFLTGANLLSYIDIFIGTTATLIAAVLSYLTRKITYNGLPVLSAVFPVVINAVIIGLELTVITFGSFNIKIFALNAFSVGLGQFISCFLLGLPLVHVLQKTKISEKYFK